MLSSRLSNAGTEEMLNGSKGLMTTLIPTPTITALTQMKRKSFNLKLIEGEIKILCILSKKANVRLIHDRGKVADFVDSTDALPLA